MVVIHSLFPCRSNSSYFFYDHIASTQCVITRSLLDSANTASACFNFFRSINAFNDFLISLECRSTSHERASTHRLLFTNLPLLMCHVQAMDQLSSMLLSPTGRKLMHDLHPPPKLVHNGNGTRCCSQRNQRFKQRGEELRMSITKINTYLDQSINRLYLLINGFFIQEKGCWGG